MEDQLIDYSCMVLEAIEKYGADRVVNFDETPTKVVEVPRTGWASKEKGYAEIQSTDSQDSPMKSSDGSGDGSDSGSSTNPSVGTTGGASDQSSMGQSGFNAQQMAQLTQMMAGMISQFMNHQSGTTNRSSNGSDHPPNHPIGGTIRFAPTCIIFSAAGYGQGIIGIIWRVKGPIALRDRIGPPVQAAHNSLVLSPRTTPWVQVELSSSNLEPFSKFYSSSELVDRPSQSGG